MTSKFAERARIIDQPDSSRVFSRGEPVSYALEFDQRQEGLVPGEAVLHLQSAEFESLKIEVNAGPRPAPSAVNNALKT